MEWFQFITLFATMVGAVFAFYKMTQEKIDKMEEFHREDVKRHDLELMEIRQEFSKVHTLWADLLKQIHEIKLDQSRKA